MKSELLKNMQYSEKFVQPSRHFSIPDMLLRFLKRIKISDVLDFGCGYGNLLRSLILFNSKLKITGVDISFKRINFLKKELPYQNFYVGDVLNFKSKEKFDLVVSTQVIEHVKNPKKFIDNFSVLLRNEGYAYINSVVKKPWAVYKYRNEGNFVLDPTHYYEFKSLNHFVSFFEKDFQVLEKSIFPVKRRLFGFEVRIPGFYIVEVLLKKK